MSDIRLLMKTRRPTYTGKLTLAAAQKKAFDKYRKGENIFITGPGGTGKTALIKEIVRDAKFSGLHCQVCALTGCAAVLLECNAKTIHSWAGIGLAKDQCEVIVDRVYKKKRAVKNWVSTDLLIIDEVSMMSQKIIELLDKIGKKCRNSNRPFGGMQVIFSGDFFQLAPVGDDDDEKTSNFCFESPVFNRLFKLKNCIEFESIFRQKDNVYQEILNQVRKGVVRKRTIKILNAQVNKKCENSLMIRPTKLYPLKRNVQKINKESMAKLKTESKTYKMFSRANSRNSKQINNYELAYLKGNTNCEEEITLKIGAQVMCIVNLLDETGVICNGSQGIITKFSDDGYPVVKYLCGLEMEMKPHRWKSEMSSAIYIEQVPLILAWAVTIHKSQGATIDLAEIDVGNNIFACGQTYVALSRVKDLSGLYLMDFDYRKIRVSKKVKDFYKKLTRRKKIKNCDGERKVSSSDESDEECLRKKTWKTIKVAKINKLDCYFD